MNTNQTQKFELPTKPYLLQAEIEWVGHRIDQNGFFGHSKTNWKNHTGPRPVNEQKFRSFLEEMQPLPKYIETLSGTYPTFLTTVQKRERLNIYGRLNE